MTDQLEYTLSQYLDGTLPPAERAALEARLESDPEARRLLEGYRRLDALLVSTAPVVPDVRWDRLAAEISSAIDEEALAPESLPMPWVGRMVRPLALAASVLVALGIGITIYLNDASAPTIEIATDPSTTSEPVVRVTGPAPEHRPGEAIAVVSVGPTASADEDLRIAEAIVTRPARVIWIASGADPAQDGRLPY